MKNYSSRHEKGRRDKKNERRVRSVNISLIGISEGKLRVCREKEILGQTDNIHMYRGF